MKCLLVAATAMEVAPFINHYTTLAKTTFINFEVELLITGVGSIAATYQITKALQQQQPDVVIQAGIAGCYNKNIKLGTVVVVKSEAMADLGVMENNGWKDVFDMKFVKANVFPYKQKKLINPHTQLLKHTGLKQVKGVTVNQVTASKKTAEGILQYYKPVAETMEGAALHFVCIMQQVAFLQVRSFSNYAGERNKKKWQLKKSIAQLNNELIRLFESF
jgi:futalosine hydrolase